MIQDLFYLTNAFLLARGPLADTVDVVVDACQWDAATASRFAGWLWVTPFCSPVEPTLLRARLSHVVGMEEPKTSALVQFLAEDELVTILPRVSMHKLHLISV